MARIEIDIPYVGPHGKASRYGIASRYRRVVPLDVREAIGRKTWLESFHARTPISEIMQRAKVLAADHDRLIDRARSGEVLSPEVIEKAEANAREWLKGDKAELHDFLNFILDSSTITAASEAFVNAVENRGRYVPDGLNLTATYERDKRLYAKGRDEKPVEYAVNSFVATIGDKELTAITRSDAVEWLAKMEAEGKAPSTIKRRVGALRAVVNRAFLDGDIDGRNPFEKHTIKDGAGGASDRLPLNKAMLALIDGYLASNQRLGPDTVNQLKILRNTGTGPAEVGGLVLSDVRLDEKIPYIWIRPNALRGVKAAARDRQIPLVGDALETAQDAYKRALDRANGKNPDEVAIFVGFNANGRGADSISGKLNATIRRAGVPKSPRLTVYSMRHSMKEAMRSAGVPDHVQRRLMGHSGQGVADRYGSPSVRLAEARDAIVSAMDYLGDVDDAIYSVNERMNVP